MNKCATNALPALVCILVFSCNEHQDGSNHASKKAASKESGIDSLERVEGVDVGDLIKSNGADSGVANDIFLKSVQINAGRISCDFEVDYSKKNYGSEFIRYLEDPYNGQFELGVPGHLRERDLVAYALALLVPKVSFQVHSTELPYERDLKIRELVKSRSTLGQ